MNKVAKNFLLNSSYQILVLLVPLITVPYISRIFGPNQIGIYSYTFSIANTFILFSMLGLSNLGSRTIAKNGNDIDKVTEVFSKLYSMQVVMSSISIIAYFVFIEFFINDNFKLFGYGQLFYLFSGLFDVTWFFFGLEKFKLTVIRNTFIKLMTTLLIFLLVKNEKDLFLYTIILSSSFLVSAFLLWPTLLKTLNLKKLKFRLDKFLFKDNLILFIPVVAVSVYRVMSKIILGGLGSIHDVGLYENANKLVSLPLGVVSALGVVMIPRVSSLIIENKKKEALHLLNDSISFILFLSTGLAFGIMAISKDFVPLFFGDKFLATEGLIYILAPSIFFIAIANVIRTQLLIPMERDKEYVKAVLWGAIVNILVNLLLIPIFGGVGSAISTLLAEIIVCIKQINVVTDELEIKKIVINCIHYIILAIPMLIVIKLISMMSINLIIKVFFEIIAGGSIYLLMTIFIKKDTFKILRKE